MADIINLPTLMGLEAHKVTLIYTSADNIGSLPHINGWIFSEKFTTAINNETTHAHIKTDSV